MSQYSSKWGTNHIFIPWNTCPRVCLVVSRICRQRLRAYFQCLRSISKTSSGRCVIICRYICVSDLLCSKYYKTQVDVEGSSSTILFLCNQSTPIQPVVSFAGASRVSALPNALVRYVNYDALQCTADLVVRFHQLRMRAPDCVWLYKADLGVRWQRSITATKQRLTHFEMMLGTISFCLRWVASEIFNIVILVQ